MPSCYSSSEMFRVVLAVLLADAAYLHHWLSVTIHFNRYNLCFDKYTECRDKCKPLYFIALHIRVVPPLFCPFMECPLSDTKCWIIEHFRRYVTERLLNTKVVVFLGFLWWFDCENVFLILIFGQLKDIVYFLIQKCVNTQLRCCKNILYWR